MKRFVVSALLCLALTYSSLSFSAISSDRTMSGHDGSYFLDGTYIFGKLAYYVPVSHNGSRYYYFIGSFLNTCELFNSLGASGSRAAYSCNARTARAFAGYHLDVSRTLNSLLTVNISEQTVPVFFTSPPGSDFADYCTIDASSSSYCIEAPTEDIDPCVNQTGPLVSTACYASLTCTGYDSCLFEAFNACPTDATLVDYVFRGPNDYDTTCKPPSIPLCDPSQTVDMYRYICGLDTDGDFIVDDDDPEPENPDINGDSDGDAVVDQYDDYPLDGDYTRDTDGDGIPNENDSTPFTYGGVNTGGPSGTGSGSVGGTGQGADDNVQPEGTGDAAIVAAQNETTSGINDVNTNLTTTNTLLGDLVDMFGEPAGDLADMNDISDAAQDESQSMIEDNFKNNSSLLNRLDTLDVTDPFSQQQQCINPTFLSNELDICTGIARIKPFLNWIFALLTLIGITNEVLTALKGR